MIVVEIIETSETGMPIGARQTNLRLGNSVEYTRLLPDRICRAEERCDERCTGFHPHPDAEVYRFSMHLN